MSPLGGGGNADGGGFPPRRRRKRNVLHGEARRRSRGNVKKEGTLQGWGQGAAAVKRIRTVGGLLSSGLFVSSWTDRHPAQRVLVLLARGIRSWSNDANVGWLARISCRFPSYLKMRMSFLVLNQRHLALVDVGWDNNGHGKIRSNSAARSES